MSRGVTEGAGDGPGTRMGMDVTLLRVFTPGRTPTEHPVDVEGRCMPAAGPRVIRRVPTPPFSVKSIGGGFEMPNAPASAPACAGVTVTPGVG